MRLVGTCSPEGGPFTCLDQSPLGELPDQIEFRVQLADGRSGNITVPLQEGNFTEFQEAYCVPIFGVIELGQVSISID